MNEKDIQRLQWDGKDRRIRLDSGLYINIRRSSKTYLIRKMVNGKAQVITLGKSPAISLRHARLKAAEHFVSKGLTVVLIRELTEKYYREIVEPKSKVPKQVRGYLNHINDRLGKLKVNDATTAECVNFIQHYSNTRGPRSADRLRSYLIQVFGYGLELGLIEHSPLSGVTKRVTGYVYNKRDRILSESEIKMIWTWKNPSHGWQKTEDNARLIKFLLLTGLRISEAQNGYVDGDKYRIDDTKGKHPKNEKRPHWVFLTKTAKKQLPLPNSTATNIQAWLRRILQSEGYIEKEDRFTPHDMRRTYATLANSSGIDQFIVEKALNHKLEGVMGVYNHAEYEQERIECARAVEAAIIKILE